MVWVQAKSDLELSGATQDLRNCVFLQNQITESFDFDKLSRNGIKLFISNNFEQFRCVVSKL